MKKISGTNIFVGNMYDYEDVRDISSWSAVHCSKDPYHKELVGYSNKLPPEHPNYKYVIVGNRMALNIVDMDRFDRRYLLFNKQMFLSAFEFIKNELERGQKVLIHCNEGISRGPMITLLYLCYAGYKGYNNLDFQAAINKFSYDNEIYMNPRMGIYETTRNLWTDFAEMGVKKRKNGKSC